MSKRHWQLARAARVFEEKKFVVRLLTKEITAVDWARTMLTTDSMHLLMGHACLEKFICLGAVLVDKEIRECDDYVQLSVKLRNEPLDLKMLRVLFEHRINQILANQIPLDIVSKVNKLHLSQAAAVQANQLKGGIMSARVVFDSVLTQYGKSLRIKEDTMIYRNAIK